MQEVHILPFCELIKWIDCSYGVESNGCTRPLNQTSGSLVQAPKEVKAEAVNRPRTPLFSICALKPTKEQSDTGTTDAYELGTLIMQ